MAHRSQYASQSPFARTTRWVLLTTTVALLGVAAAGPRAQVSVATSGMGLVVSRNVNMVSGQTLPNGDPYLQRQNEPSVAASTRNPLHLIAGANDYRTVDIPGNFDDGETGDAWLGVFKSVDGGERWTSSLLPGYPQDQSKEGMASPLKAYNAGADPVVRPGTNGLLYYSGLAFNRGEGGASAIFLARFIDNNNKEAGDPFAYISTSVIASSTGAEFLDKPWMAVDVPRAGARVCRIPTTQAAPAPPPRPRGRGRDDDDDDDRRGRGRRGGDRYSSLGKLISAAAKNIRTYRAGRGKPPLPTPGLTQLSQEIQAGAIHVAWAAIKTTTNAAGVSTVTSRLMYSRSDDCGATWSRPMQISDPAHPVNQGATLAVDPANGNVHVAWRQFGMDVNAPDAIMTTTIPANAKLNGKPRRVHLFPTGRRADQLLAKLQRAHRHGQVKELVSIKPFDSGTADDRFRTNAYPSIAIDDESRVYLAWTERGYGGANPDPNIGDARIVLSTSRNGGPFTAPKAIDSKPSGQDLPGHQLMPAMSYSGGRLLIVYYDLRQDVSQVFGPFIDENDAIYTQNRRHTIDVRAVQAPKADDPVFTESTLVSQYPWGNLRGSTRQQQLQYNAPNLPLFQLGTVPFMGDYIDVAPAPAFVQNTAGRWTYNTTATTAPVFHAVWTDNRDVQKPADGNWQNYTPPGSSSCVAGQTGMRNQNVYSARITMGLVAGSPGNAKPLDPELPRAFVVFAQNLTYTTKTFRFAIVNQPIGGAASFDQIGDVTGAPLLTTVDVKVAPRSMVTRTVYATSSNAKEQVRVDVTEIAFPQATTAVVGGLATRVVLNPDISNPDISNPDISNPDISNPDISNPDISNAEVYNPDISNPDISNPDISNPDISNPDISNPDISNMRIANPDISNPDISNPDISNPDISNPDISNPDISNPDISNGSITDVTWTITNTGNTTAAFNVNLFLANQAASAGGIKTQLVVHKTYKTPISNGCVLLSQTQTVLVANVLNPTFKVAGDDPAFDPANPDISNTTLWLEPGGTGRITLRIVDPNPTDNITLNPVTDVKPVVQALPINTPDLGNPTAEPPSTPLPTDPVPPPPVTLAFVAQPTDTLANVAMAPIVVSATSGANPAPGVQVTLAIALNPSGGKLDGTVTLLTDAGGIATFSGLSIDRDGVNYGISASASASGALPILSTLFTIGAVVPPSPFIVTTMADSGPGSLRAAITAANAAPDVNTITFNIPGPTERLISLDSPLPTLTTMMTIDGTTQPGYDGRPMVRVDGGGTIGHAFDMSATSELIGLSVTRFTNWAVIVMNGVNNAVVERMYLGATRNGTPGFGNGIGVRLNYSSGARVEQSLISGNAIDGVLVLGGTGNQINTNHIGTGLDGQGALPNLGNGITLYDGSTNTTINGNVISGNGTVGVITSGFGIDIQHSGALADVVNTVITNNTIGLDATGALIERGGGDYLGTDATNYGNVNRGNAAGGIRVQRGSGTVIGQVGAGNTISGNTLDGVTVTGPTSASVKIVANRIGTDQAGNVGRANTLSGVVADSPDTVVGGPAPGEGNVISGNLGDGVSINAANVLVRGNLIGTSANGLTALGNGPELQAASVGNRTGIKVGAVPGVVIGGVAPGARNVVSGNRLGILVYWDTTNIRIEGNYIGTDITGNAGIPNGANGQGEGGILLLGGNTPGGIGSIISFNRIMFNTGYGGGIYTGTGPQAGLYEGNVIAFNTGAGIVLRGGPAGGEPIASARFKENLIYGNTGVGIDLGGDGATPNDVGDGDVGSNLLQNFPVLSAATSAGAATTVNVALDSQFINANHTIEIFASTACDASGFGEGERLVGSFVQMTDGAGDFSLAGVVLNELVPIGQYLTATATINNNGWTSEFSQCVLVTSGSTITSATPANGMAGEGFLALRGTNLPATLGDVVAEVTSGVVTANGFWFPGASSSTVGYVRLPALPLGAATVRLRNNAGTVVTNAFPITISAVPGTPVITAVRDGSLNIVAAPVLAATSVYVGADGIDTTGAVVRFTQGARTWDVSGTVSSGQAEGVMLQVNVPGDAMTGPIDVTIRQGVGAFSAATTISVSNPGFIGTAGGPGGNPFGPVTCGPGTVLTALTGEAGSYLGQMTMWCAPVLPGPSLGAAVASTVIGIPGVGPVDFGAALTCPANHAMTGIFGTAGDVGWGVVVDGLGVRCTDVTTGAVSTSGMVGDQGTTPFNFTCPAGGEAIGFAGGFGGVLDRIGVVCGDPVPEPGGSISASTPSNQLSTAGDQMIWLSGTGLTGLSAADVLFSSNGGPESAAQYVWTITPTLAVARPQSMAAGVGYVRVKNPAGTLTSNNYPIVWSNTPGTPNAVMTGQSCTIGFGGQNTPQNSGAVGTSISVHTAGVNTSGSIVEWSNGGPPLSTSSVLTTTGGVSGTVALCVNVPPLPPGTYQVGVRHTSPLNATTSAVSNLLTFTITAPPAEGAGT